MTRRSAIGTALTLFVVSATGPRAADVAIRLIDVADQAGLTLLNIHGGPDKDYIVDTNGNGAAWLDYDRDGDLDALIVNGSTLENLARGGDPMAALYQNDGKGRFRDVTGESRLVTRGWGMGTCVADYDNDGYQDIYLTAFGPNVLLRNNGNGTFSDATRAAGVGDPRWGTNCAFGDYDRDGRVDLYVANYLTFDARKIPKRGESSNCRYLGMNVFCGPTGLPGEPDVLYRNNGDGTFTDVTDRAGIRDPGHHGFGVLFSDLDDDGWPDLFVANDSVPNLLFRNNRDGTFVEEGLASGVALSGDGRAQASMGVDAGDYDGDGDLDLVVTNFSDDYTVLYENSAQLFFTDATHRAGMGLPPLRYLGWGVGWVDLDNDGLLDLFVANGHVYPAIDRQGINMTFRQRKQIYRNVGSGRLREITNEVAGGLLIERSSRGAAFGDYDNDGDVDVLVTNINDRPTLLRNDTARANHWIGIRLDGTKSNRDGIGARIRVRAGGRTHTTEVRSGGSYLSHNDIRAHVGLGDGSRIEQLEIRWPSGVVDTLKGLAADRFYVAREGRGVAEN